MSIVSRAARFLASGSLAGGFAVGGIVKSYDLCFEIVGVVGHTATETRLS